MQQAPTNFWPNLVSAHRNLHSLKTNTNRATNVQTVAATRDEMQLSRFSLNSRSSVRNSYSVVFPPARKYNRCFKDVPAMHTSQIRKKIQKPF